MLTSYNAARFYDDSYQPRPAEAENTAEDDEDSAVDDRILKSELPTEEELIPLLMKANTVSLG